MSVKEKITASMYVDMYYDSFFHIESSFEGLQESIDKPDMDVELQSYVGDFLKHSLTIIFFTVATLEATLFSYGSDIREEINISKNIGTLKKWIEIVQSKIKKPINNKLIKRVKRLINLRNTIVHLEPLQGRVDTLCVIDFIENLRKEAIIASSTTEDFLLEIQRHDTGSIIINDVLDRIRYWKSYINIENNSKWKVYQEVKGFR